MGRQPERPLRGVRSTLEPRDGKVISVFGSTCSHILAARAHDERLQAAHGDISEDATCDDAAAVRALGNSNDSSFDQSLSALLDCHTALVIRMRALNERAWCDEKIRNELMLAVATEKSLCQQLADFPAHSIEDAEAKIVHFVGYLWQTKGFFDDETLDRFFDSLRHISQQA
jgi:hypothetical protein